MSYKTERLVNLFPDAYAATDTASLLYRLLDAIAAELMGADEAVKELLKSHWVDYAGGPALDGLGAIYGVARRRIPGPTPEQVVLETDAAFRLRLKSIVPLFTGGGTRQAVLGAVRSALGLPFDLDQLNLPAEYDQLRQDLENLITLVEFAPSSERLVDEITAAADAGELTLDVPFLSTKAQHPRIEWTFTQSSGSLLQLERLDSGAGIVSIPGDGTLVIAPGETLSLSAGPDGELQAFVGIQDVSAQFSNIGGGAPMLPQVPAFASQWRFTAANAALFDHSQFDQDTFDQAWFKVEMRWQRFRPLTFDVFVPYYLKTAVDKLKGDHGYPGDIFVYKGLDLETIQKVVDQTRAAGVRGSVHFSLNFRTRHDQRETFTMQGEHQHKEYADAGETLSMSSRTQLAEAHDVTARLTLGGIFDVSVFDGDFGYH